MPCNMREESSASSPTALLAKSNQFKRNTKGRVNKEYEKVHKIKETQECYFCHRKGHLATACRYAKQKELKAKKRPKKNLNRILKQVKA